MDQHGENEQSDGGGLPWGRGCYHELWFPSWKVDRRRIEGRRGVDRRKRNTQYGIGA